VAAMRTTGRPSIHGCRFGAPRRTPTGSTESMFVEGDGFLGELVILVATPFRGSDALKFGLATTPSIAREGCHREQSKTRRPHETPNGKNHPMRGIVNAVR